MIFKCGITECTFNDETRCICCSVEITHQGCKAYEDSIPIKGEWEHFYSREITRNGTHIRVDNEGRPIKISGRDMYAVHNENDIYPLIYDKYSGILLGSLEIFRTLSKEMKVQLDNLPNINELPYADYYLDGKRWVIVREDKK